MENKGAGQKKIAIIISAVAVGLLAIVLIFVFVILPLFKGNKFEIKTVEIQLDGKNVGNEISKEFTEADFIFSVIINNNEDNDKDRPEIKWSITDEKGLNCEINNNGKFTIGDTLGVLKVQVSVTSKNTLSKGVDVNIVAPNEFILHSIQAIPPQGGLNFIEGQTFNPSGLKVQANFLNKYNEEFQVYVLNYDYDNKTKLNPLINETDISYAHMEIERIDIVYFGVRQKTIQSLEITKAPGKTNFIEGEQFDVSGLEVTAHYEYIDEVLSDNDYVIEEGWQFLVPATTSISITYERMTAKQPIKVARRTLQSIEIVSPPKKTDYTHGQTLNKDGLSVLAYYEKFNRDVTSEVKIKIDEEDINNYKVCYGDREIIVLYEENGIVKTRQIEITVKEPYEDVRKIIFKNPLDATLSWLYEYGMDDGISVIDNTEVVEGLKFDSVNGEYIAPVGAMITIMRVNPAAIDFIINNERCGLQYPEDSFSFELVAGEDILIEFEMIDDTKILVRFSEDEKMQNWALIYSANWNSPMSANDLSKIPQIYPDTDEYYYEYTVKQRDDVDICTFSKLSEIVINADTLIQVKKIERIKEETQIITINVVYSDEVSMDVVIDKTGSIDLYILPQILKTGYILGFSDSQEEGARLLDSNAFIEWLNKANNGDALYAVYTLDPELQLGGINDTWGITVTDQGRAFSLTVEFKENGTYIYTVVNDDGDKIEEYKFKGVYTLSGNIITILSIESDLEYQLVSAEDFNETPFELDNGKLNAPLFIIIGLTLESGQIKGLEKV